MSKVDFAETAHKEIQGKCRRNGYVFFYDMTKDEFMDEAYDYIMKFPGWLIPISQEKEFIEDRNNDNIGEKWKGNYLMLGAFNDFEGTGEWLFSIEIDNETKPIKPGCV